MLDRSQWIAIGLVSGFAYILGKDRESFGAEDKDEQNFPIIDSMTNKEFKDFVSNNYPSDDEDARVLINLTDNDEYLLDDATVAKNHPFADDDDLVITPETHVGFYYFDKEAESFGADVESVVSELRELGMPQIIFEDGEERIKINGELVYKMEATPMPIRDGIYSQPLFYIGSKHDVQLSGKYIVNPMEHFSPPLWIRTPKGLIKNTRFHRNKILQRKIQRRLQEDYKEYAKKNPFECLCGKRFKNDNALKKHQKDKKHPNYHPSHTLFDNELKGPPINIIRNPDGITLKEVYLMFPNWDGNYKTWDGKGKKPLQQGFNYFNAESFEAEYGIHDNGGRPFLVKVSNNNVEIYQEEMDSDGNWNYTKLIKKYKPLKTFIGKSLLNPTTEFSGGYGKEFDGNSILLKIGTDRYVYIGSIIYEFSTDGDEIVKYYSPVGNNDVPYPFAYGKKNVYLMERTYKTGKEKGGRYFSYANAPTHKNKKSTDLDWEHYFGLDEKYYKNMKNVKSIYSQKDRMGWDAESFDAESDRDVYIVTHTNFDDRDYEILGVFSKHSDAKKLMEKIFIEEIKLQKFDVLDESAPLPSKSEITKAKKKLDYIEVGDEIYFTSPYPASGYYQLEPYNILDSFTHPKGYHEVDFSAGVLNFNQYVP